jgi:hypothetical protein
MVTLGKRWGMMGWAAPRAAATSPSDRSRSWSDCVAGICARLGVGDVRFERVEGGVEPLQALSEIALRSALVEVFARPVRRAIWT